MLTRPPALQPVLRERHSGQLDCAPGGRAGPARCPPCPPQPVHPAGAGQAGGDDRPGHPGEDVGPSLGGWAPTEHQWGWTQCGATSLGQGKAKPASPSSWPRPQRGEGWRSGAVVMSGPEGLGWAMPQARELFRGSLAQGVGTGPRWGEDRAVPRAQRDPAPPSHRSCRAQMCPMSTSPSSATPTHSPRGSTSPRPGGPAGGRGGLAITQAHPQLQGL